MKDIAKKTFINGLRDDLSYTLTLKDPADLEGAFELADKINKHARKKLRSFNNVPTGYQAHFTRADTRHISPSRNYADYQRSPSPRRYNDYDQRYSNDPSERRVSPEPTRGILRHDEETRRYDNRDKEFRRYDDHDEGFRRYDSHDRQPRGYYRNLSPVGRDYFSSNRGRSPDSSQEPPRREEYQTISSGRES